jgi:hypothetical protein
MCLLITSINEHVCTIQYMWIQLHLCFDDVHNIMYIRIKKFKLNKIV